MKSLKKIAGYNLLAILLYSVIIRLVCGNVDMAILIYSAMIVGAHVFTCVIISLMFAADKKKDYARAWLAAAGIVLLVGFSACYGNASL